MKLRMASSSDLSFSFMRASSFSPTAPYGDLLGIARLALVADCAGLNEVLSLSGKAVEPEIQSNSKKVNEANQAIAIMESLRINCAYSA